MQKEFVEDASQTFEDQMEQLLQAMIEQTLVLVKHDGVARSLVGEIIKRFETLGLKLCALKMAWADEKLAENHYKATKEWIKSVAEKTRKGFAERGINLKESDEEIAERIRKWNKQYLREGPIVAIVLEGPHAIELIRKLVGHTEPRQALPGTIRGDFGYESYALGDYKQRPIRNLVHASSSKEEATREIGLWFRKDEIHSYSLPNEKNIA